MEVYYIPRNIVNYDQLNESDDQSTYTQAIPLDVYLEDYGAFGGSGDLYNKFGLDINDQIQVYIARRHYEQYVLPILQKSRPLNPDGTPRSNFRPDEGDLIYFIQNHKCFQIRFTNNKELFFELGKLPGYTLTCELFEYSDETFNTGIEEIDSIQTNLSLNQLVNAVNTYISNTAITTENANNIITLEKFDVHNINPVSDDDTLNLEGNTFIDFTSPNVLGNISLTQD